jgi:hypothetical protein
MTNQQIDSLVDRLLTNGGGEKADRLVLYTEDGRDLGGRNRDSVRKVIVSFDAWATVKAEHRMAFASWDVPWGVETWTIFASDANHAQELGKGKTEAEAWEDAAHRLVAPAAGPEEQNPNPQGGVPR